jgi:uncharacterized protein
MSHQDMRHPGRWLWLILLVPVALGFARLRFDADVLNLLPRDLPAVKGLRVYQEHFANARELILTIRAPDALTAEMVSQTISTRLRSATNLVKASVWQSPWMENPAQGAELVAYYWLNQSPSNVAGLATRLAAQNLGATLVAAREELATSMSPGEIARLSYDPFGFTSIPEVGEADSSFLAGGNIFASDDGKFRIQFVKSATDLATYVDCENWLKAVKEIIHLAVDSTGTAASVKIGYTGRPAFVTEIAAGMQRDMKFSVGGTAIVIGILFWLAHRRWKPMLWLVTLLAIILLSSLGLGGLLFGSINVVSMGFAAILLGLAVDYGVVHYQEAIAQPHLSVPRIRRVIAPSIFWAATTTIAAFLALNFGGLPGLAQLGNLVGIGVLLAACVMVYEFLPVLFPERNHYGVGIESHPIPSPSADVPRTRAFIPAMVGGLAIVVSAVTIFCLGLPRIDTSANALRPGNSPAYSTLAEVQAHLGQEREPCWLVFEGATESEVADKMRESEAVLFQARTNGLIDSFTLPTQLWPQSELQQHNRELVQQLVEKRELLRTAALTNGFSPVALALTDRILDTWQIALSKPGVYWPENPMSQWVLQNFTAHGPEGYYALGLVEPHRTAKGQTIAGSLLQLSDTLPRAGVWVSGWELLGHSIFERVRGRFPLVLIPMVCLSILSLCLAFRRLPEVLLSLAVLGLSGVWLLAVMRSAGWSWNLLNMMGVPLILGTGIDYSIFMQLALRRFHGDTIMAHRSVGRALLLCGGTAIAGFGALGLSSNAGMASLGRVCAIGIAGNMLISIYLLPGWWTRTAVARRNPASDERERNAKQSLRAPSSLYRSELWFLAVKAVKCLPLRLCEFIARSLVAAYWLVARRRCEVVVQNLLPVLGGDVQGARAAARNLFRNFGLKLIDLWRYEGGMSVQHLLGTYTGWDNMVAAGSQKRGVLVLTPHLGNWEFGGPWLTERGIDLHVITLEEPGEGFTRFRKEARARWQIKTVVIGNDPFGFVQIIRLLESGATVALLVDRPSPATSTMVNLFGRSFSASVAAAELARASGCALLPVYVVREGLNYTAHILPQVTYERAMLRDRGARQALTQRIMDSFEPAIRQHADQWYNFVPVWPEAAGKTPGPSTQAGQDRAH